METSPARARISFAHVPSVCVTEQGNVKEAAFHEQHASAGEHRASAGNVIHCAVPNSCGPIAQWQSGRLITVWSQVRTLLGPPFADSITTDERDTGGARLLGLPRRRALGRYKPCSFTTAPKSTSPPAMAAMAPFISAARSSFRWAARMAATAAVGAVSTWKWTLA